MAIPATKCVECDTPTLILRLTGLCGAKCPDIDVCPFAVKTSTALKDGAQA